MDPIWQLMLIQVVVPVVLILLNALVPASSWWAIAVRIAFLGVVITWLVLAGLWLYPPRWTPYALAILAVVSCVPPTMRLLRRETVPRRGRRWSEVIVVGIVGLALAVVLLPPAVGGRSQPDAVVALAPPLGAGSYYIASGGTTRSVNAHLATLDGPRSGIWRGQSRAVDLVKVDGLGRRADGIAPADPTRYFIFGEPVLAPCAGTVVATESGRADQRVPQVDRDNLPGNLVLLACGDVEVLLAHLRQHSVVVGPGQKVVPGTLLGEVGNTGNTSEPHLHIHAQRPSPDPAKPLAGEPLWITVDGRFPVRNQVLHFD